MVDEVPSIDGSTTPDRSPQCEQEEAFMTAFAARVTNTVDVHPRLIAGVLGAVILFFLAACLLHHVTPACHWQFKCDHRMH